ncbi:MAG: HEAT repeat domain-containing protein [Terriglobia bacterium]
MLNRHNAKKKEFPTEVLENTERGASWSLVTHYGPPRSVLSVPAAVNLLVVCLLVAATATAQAPGEPAPAAPTNSQSPPASEPKPSKPGASNPQAKASAAQPDKTPAAAASLASTGANANADTDTEGLPPEDWAVQLLDAMVNGPSGDARDAVLDAAFAAGPAVIPQLEAGLKDDRTAEFAAQALAYVGGGDALKILAGLLDDPRDLDLRRFYFAALGEYKAPEASKILLYAMNHADEEPDRTVIEAAILALTVQADTSMVPQLQAAEKKIKDYVLHDDLENAIAVIQTRAQVLARPAGPKPGGSVDDAVRTYFLPALEPPASAPGTGRPKPQHASLSPATSAPHGSLRPPAKPIVAKPAKPEGPPGVKVDILSLTLSPNNERALARVLFDTPEALAYYDLILQKREGNWNVASVWLDSEAEKPQPKTRN